MDFYFAAIPAIVVICYLAAEVVKATPLDNKWLPVIAGVFGGILGAVTYFTTGGTSQDILTSIATGIVSGLAATGVDQIGKQLRD